MFFHKSEPIPQIWLNRFFLAIIILLALVAGYFYTETQRLVEKCAVVQDTQSMMYSLFSEKR